MLIPEANVRHLALHPEVIDAVREGRFAVHAVRTVDEGLSLFQLDPVSESRRVGAAQNATDQACFHLDLKLPEKDGLLLSSAIAANTSCFLTGNTTDFKALSGRSIKGTRVLPPRAFLGKEY